MSWEPSGLGGFTAIELRDGRTAWLEATASRLLLHVGAESAALPIPRHGYGGHELLASPDESYVVLWLYSGQSEVGYELFRLGPLSHAASFPYVYGEGVGPVFSADSRRLALAWSVNSGLNLDELPLDDDGFTTEPALVDWAVVRVVDLPADSPRTCTVRVRIAAGSPCERDESFYPDNLRFEGDALILVAPWGPRLKLAPPWPDTITIDGPVQPEAL
jgi:hypothetical protein